jgi:hypothetical protein
MVLWLRGGGRVDVLQPPDVRIDRDSGTIAVAMPGGTQEILFEDLLAIELRPRCPAPHRPES